MTSADFNRSIDFSTLGAPAGGASYVQELDEAAFDAVVRKSMQHPVVVELYSPRAHGGQQVSEALAEVAQASAGKFLLARVNVDEQPRIAQALGVQAVPTVVAVLGGQLAPLFQGTADKDQVSRVIDQVLQAAAANGIMGRAEPVASQPVAATPEGDVPASDPRFAAADEALVAGDYAKAVVEFDKLLAATPGDLEATAGRAQAALLARSVGMQPDAVAVKAHAAPNDLDAQFDAADLEIIQGSYEPALDRLLTLAASLDAEGRDQVRVRLLELFDVIGRTDPVVLKARRRLSGLLF